MDPNVIVKNMVELSTKMQKDYVDPESNGIDQDDAAELAQQVLNLNTWLAQGGFLPINWMNK